LEEPLMTQNGPYPGPPSQPWSGRGSSDEPYTEPADPWGDHPTSDAGGTGWGPQPPPVPQQPQYPAAPLNTPPPSWGRPVPPPRKRNTPIVALVIVLGLLICGGLGTTAWLISSRGEPTASDLEPSTPTTTATTEEVEDPRPRGSEDARFVTKGQCVRNEGSADKPEMMIVPCASGTFEVLKRVDGRTGGSDDAEQKCTKVTGYTKWYFYDSELDSLDFVLCLKDR
jgi:hypothetical protein